MLMSGILPRLSPVVESLSETTNEQGRLQIGKRADDFSLLLLPAI